MMFFKFHQSAATILYWNPGEIIVAICGGVNSESITHQFRQVLEALRHMILHGPGDVGEAVGTRVLVGESSAQPRITSCAWTPSKKNRRRRGKQRLRSVRGGPRIHPTTRDNRRTPILFACSFEEAIRRTVAEIMRSLGLELRDLDWDWELSPCRRILLRGPNGKVHSSLQELELRNPMDGIQ
ncbi:hypothetical protein HAX54_049734 [Datura stramonium]|uniref:Uncharacterized protein n=1 Tax=Datura stramonium TaxID=4076 RepID=A0ABS8WN95_DATST|nr:hypothetical protein [Datura stramonium]